MSVLNIVLVEPQIPQNTGNIARTCAATGARLHLVEPMGFRVDDAITYYCNLDDFFERNKDGNFYYFSTKATHLYSDIEYPDNCYLVFGKETAGLPEELLYHNPDTSVRLPMINDASARSLNLSNTVAVGVYEVLRQWGFPELLTQGKLTKFSWNK